MKELIWECWIDNYGSDEWDFLGGTPGVMKEVMERMRDCANLDVELHCPAMDEYRGWYMVDEDM
jgi:hypothetical protein